MKPMVIRFFIPYAIFLLFALFIGWFMHEQTLSVVETQMKDANMMVLDQGKEILDLRLDEVASIVRQLELDPKVAQFLTVERPLEGTNTYRIVEMHKHLYEHGLTNKFITNYYLLFRRSNMVINRTMAEQLPAFYEYRYSVADKTYEQWYSEIFDKFRQFTVLPASPMLLDGKPHTMLTYIHSMGLPPVSSGVIAVSIDNREVQTLLEGLDLSTDGWAYIADKDGRLISYVTKGSDVIPEIVKLDGDKGVLKMGIGSKEMMVTYTTSTYNGWKYVTVQPTHIVLEKVNYVKRITLFIAIGSLFLGIGLAIVLAYRNWRPVGRLVTNNEQLQQKLKDQMPFLRHAFFERLLKGEFASDSEIELLMEHLGIRMEGNGFVVVLLHLRDHDNEEVLSTDMLLQRELHRLLLREYFSTSTEIEVYLHDVESSKLAAIIGGTFSSQEVRIDFIRELLEETKEEMGQLHGMHPVFAIGSVQPSYKGIARSYEEAKYALNYNIWHRGKDTVWFEQLPKESHKYYFPTDTEQRLMNVVRAGETEQLQQMMEELFDENFVHRTLSLQMLQLFIANLIGNMLKLSEQLLTTDLGEAIPVLAKQADSLEGARAVYHQLTEILLAITDAGRQRKKSGNIELVHQLVTYLQDSYSNPDLSLSAVADYFQLSETYLSRIFKEHTGHAFSDYLEELRMKRAGELLQDTDLPVSVIVKEVGYQSSNTFGRAFKRVYGVSATSFRSAGKP
ncbi:hypothetical protein ASG89_09755 [Paenibacillus sp. Soil766]|uniref:helix-turn-helix domain-containing protein n=1 Tax=Paenibacillus sp. Soil766 TaxID=1736404 RepID=UPI00070F67F6|nr:helix-turn-helix domain-containing protein [Paenibacillus sp. Soil766]KRE86301.1 hypothetical protein ASG89_09755 [Paenibacillus sp. Soil766]